MTRSTPPLQGIEAFILATRASSFRAAADRLALSPSAFSRRIQTLENFLGVALFDRSTPRPRLTDTGEIYRRQIESAINAICEATSELRALRQGAHLRVMCSQSFAIAWLMPRLQSCADSAAPAQTEIEIGRDLEMLRVGRAEMAIASDPREFEGLPSEPLISLDGIAVTAPTLRGGRRPPTTLDELAEHRLLAVDTPRDLWPRWLAQVGHHRQPANAPIYFDTLTLMYEAAANGLGVAIAMPAVAERYLKEGRLQPCFEARAQLNAGYSVVYASHAVQRRLDVQAFTLWLKQEMEDSRMRFSAVARPAPHTSTDLYCRPERMASV
ncbi:MAG: LysR substrate-binding domain-containing protein [Steroidobacter sp.]